MMELFWIYLAIGAACIGYAVGYRSARHKIITLDSLSAKRAFAFYVFRERQRHMDDINQIDRDLETLKNHGVYPPDLPLDRWIEVR